MISPNTGDDRSSQHDDRVDSTSVLDDDTIAAVAAERDAHVGVKKVEAALRVYGSYSRWCLFIGYVPLSHHRGNHALSYPSSCTVLTTN